MSELTAKIEDEARKFLCDIPATRANAVEMAAFAEHILSKQSVSQEVLEAGEAMHDELLANDNGNGSSHMDRANMLKNWYWAKVRANSTMTATNNTTKTTYTYIVLIVGGLGPDVWDKEVTVEAENIVSAALKATKICSEFNGHIVSIEQES